MSYSQELKQIPLLSCLDEGELERLSQLMMKRQAKKGSYILHANDPGANILFILEGRVKVSLVGNEGKEIVIDHFEEGELFGELSVLTGELRSADVVALENSTLFVLSKDDFDHHILEHSGLTRALLKELAFRIRSSSEKIGSLALHDVYRRVALTLKALARTIDLGTEELLVVEKRPTHQEIAAMVGSSREVVTRALKGLEEDGHIQMDGKRIEIKSFPD